MSRLNDLIRQVREKDPALAADLEREVGALADRRSFGLNFERHIPEVVELPGRKVRRSDKVRILPARGTMPTKADEKLWRVAGFSNEDGLRIAALETLNGESVSSAAVEDLVVVAEFRDPIYPGLISTGKVERGGEKPFHAVINAENYHALQALLFTHRGQVDCIYIDPPYNTGAAEWIYNDRYVGADDLYRHSKWLAFIERRLILARELLKNTGVLIIAIGDDEHHHLRILMDQVFGDANFVSDVVWQGGRKNDSRYVSNSADYMLIYARDEAALASNGIRWREKKPGVDDALSAAESIWAECGGDHSAATVKWRVWIRNLKRQGTSSDAVTRFVNLDNDGRPIRTDADLRSPNPRPNLQYDLIHPVTGKPVRMHPNGWMYSRDTMAERVARGLVHFGPDHTTGAGGVSYLDTMDTHVPESVFIRDRNTSGKELAGILGSRRFPNPKDPDILMRWIGIVAPADSLVLDFFGGSGTTTEAVMRLNEGDGGTRRSILVTNNELDATKASSLLRAGLRRGDTGWEEKGVHDYVTKPRISTIVSGVGPDESTYANTVDANVEFFTLTYEDALRVSSHREFARIAPLLWMRAGSRGRRIEELVEGWDVAETYGVLSNLDRTDQFLQAIRKQPRATLAFVVTEEERLFQAVAQGLPEGIEPVRLYDAYLRTFEIEAGEGRAVKFTLKDYQADAVDAVLQTLERARSIYKRGDGESSFSLTATTGAGKTVMAAAVIESLFYGNESLEFDPDPGAVVIWFSDDPSLNDQTRMRLMEASEKLGSSDLVTIAHPFSVPRLQAGKVYFLNTGKLTKNSLLTRGHVDDVGMIPELRPAAQPDLQGWTIWETIANTIKDDNLTVYLILDEAHRGFNTKTTSDKPTIVRRLVHGDASYPPIPVVWGISATIQHFQEAMKEADAAGGRRALPPVVVDPLRVQESGLVKDTVVLDIPAEAGNFDSVLVRRAAKRLKDSTERWQAYAATQKTIDPVRPLLLLQTPNTPNPDDVGLALATIFAEYPDLPYDSVRHVLSDHSVQKFGSFDVEWIEPQRVEETTKVRVLVAKDAISYGWDCPRAEVLVSFRPAKDHTHITQLLGRMVRNPLARRVPGDERLNSVDCILPFFDRTTAGNVVKYLTGQLEEMPGAPTKKVLVDAKELRPNPHLPVGVWECWDSLPTMLVPQRGARPVKRLVALAQALSADGVRPDALKEAETFMHRVLDSCAVKWGPQIQTAAEEVWAVRGQSIAGTVGKAKLTYSDFVERADDRAIRVAFDDAKKAFGADIAQSYVDHLAPDDPDAPDDGLRDAYVRIAALATVTGVREQIDRDAAELAGSWFAQHRVALLALPDDRQQEYQTIRAMAAEPQAGNLMRPRTRMEGYSTEPKDGQFAACPLAAGHLMSDEDGMFPIGSLNDWERSVLAAEMGREGAVAWYRNPARSAVDALGITYRDVVGNWRSLQPDFIFFHRIDGEVRASIVDPHGLHLEDSMVKLKGVATFAKDHGAAFHRIESVTMVGTAWWGVSFQSEDARQTVRHAEGPAVDLFLPGSGIAIEYDAIP